MDPQTLQALRNHIREMKAKVTNIRWDVNALNAKADATEREAIELEILIDRLESKP